MPKTKRTAALTEGILTRVAEGESLRAVCCDEGMPAASTFLLWCKQDEALAEHYARAMEARADALFDEMFEIADDAVNDWMKRTDPENEGWQLNGEHIQRAKLRIDTRKWALARMNAKKYGDRTVLAGDEDAPLQINVVERRERRSSG